MQPTVSIIIVTYGSAREIDACLDALSQLQTALSHEIIVVDNASQDDTVSRIRARQSDVRLLAEAENWGFAGGVNRGVIEAQGQYIALLNPDAVARPAWLDELIAPFADPTIGVTGSKVLDGAGRIQSIGALLAVPLLLTSHRGEGETDSGQYDAPADVWGVHGAAMAFRKQLWQQIGGFDEGYFPAYLEESDFCERARRAGYRIVTAPRSVVGHTESSSTGKFSAEFYYYYLRNRLRFAVKWHDWPMLWNEFRPAEQLRLHEAPLLDRRVARLVYHQGIPHLTAPDAAARAAILATGRRLRAGTLPADGLGPLLDFAAEAADNSVLREVTFHSRLPLLATLRTAWNNIATRWYVRPSFDQQTRFNLALERALHTTIEQTAARTAADALDIALLAWKLEQSH
ncbi:MAG: glycosyltransferase family 2 protein [Chloroflexi bacterium]|nr:glycosyltransferase family 2 protein [Chloroflexota bacterium]